MLEEGIINFVWLVHFNYSGQNTHTNTYTQTSMKVQKSLKKKLKERVKMRRLDSPSPSGTPAVD